MATMTIEVVTPERAVLVGEAEEIVIPGTEGQMGILPGHLPLLSGVAIGQMVVKGFKGTVGREQAQGDRKFFVDGGFVEVLPDKVTIMTEACDGYDEIDVSAARKEIEAAERELLAIEERAKSEEVEADILQRHQDALKRARTRLLMHEDE